MLKTLKTYLENNLSKATKIAVLGIGSELRQDDAAGIVAAKLIKEVGLKQNRGVKVKVFIGETAPENLTGEIKAFKPSHIILIDTVDMGEKPGTVAVLKPQEIGEGVSFSTHTMPAKILSDYFSKSFKCDITMLGIQPSSVKFGNKFNRHVKQSSEDVAKAINSAIANL